jgi:outer membrane protein OmpA-like peptidoglycan-associated protein
MKLRFGVLSTVLAGVAAAQTIVVMPPSPPPPPPVIVKAPTQFLIAFKDSAVSLAQAYWVTGNVLCYVTSQHQLRTAPLERVDVSLSERLNAEQNVTFRLPASADNSQLLGMLARQLSQALETHNTPNGLVLQLPDVLFGVSQYDLTTDARDRLGRVASVLTAYPGVTVAVNGFTDNTGGREYNLQLSKRRAEAAREFLIARGVPAGTVTATGFGEANPVATNATAEGRRMNRRVEMVVGVDGTGATGMGTAPTE